MAKDYAQANFRIPIELKAALEQAAERNHRSLTAEIVSRLEESFPTMQQEFDFAGMGNASSSPPQAPKVPGWVLSEKASPYDIRRYALEALRQGIDALNVLQSRQELDVLNHPGGDEGNGDDR